MPKNSYSKTDFKNDLEDLRKLIHSNKSSSQKGGKKKSEVAKKDLRRFKVVMLDQKEVDIGEAEINKTTQTPVDAAKKLLRSIALHKGMKGSAKLRLDAVFVIQETTRDSKTHGKRYGPYSGKYRKYTPAEQAAAKTDDGKVKFTMTSVVKKYKSKNQKEFYNKAMRKRISTRMTADMKMNKEMKMKEMKMKKNMKMNKNMMKGGH